MPDSKVGIPFAFLLALSATATASDAGASVLGDGAELLKPGSMRNLLDRLDRDQPLLGNEAEGERSNQDSTHRIAQWFNGGFFSCFQGYWRRC
jgi:hypothetical protein